MQLSDKTIHCLLKSGELVFLGTNQDYPFLPETQVQPASIDLRLGNRIVTFSGDITAFDIKDIKQIERHLNESFYGPEDPIVVPPNGIVYGEIYELMSIGESVSARIQGRSRTARLGLSVHCTGDYINPGWQGSMPLQIVNHNAFPITLYPYTEICQIFFYQLSDTPLVSYAQRATYNGEEHAGPSVLSPPCGDGAQGGNLMKQKMKRMIESYIQKMDSHQESSRLEQKTSALIQEQASIVLNINVGGNIMGDTYNAMQGGIQGPHAGAGATVIMQYGGGSAPDWDALAQEIATLREYLRSAQELDPDERDILAGHVAEASRAAKGKDESKAFGALKEGGKKLLDIAKNIGCSLVASFLFQFFGSV